MLQAVIFDADAVFLNAGEIHFQAFNRALATKGWMITQAEHRSVFNGLPTLKKLEFLSEHRGFPSVWHHEILELKQQLTLEVINDFIQPDPEKEELVQELAKSGLLLGAASNMQQLNLEALLNKIGILNSLDVVIGHDRIGYNRVKPLPDLFLHTATALGCSVDVSAVVVDRSLSLDAAKAADPLDIIIVDSHEDVNAELLPRILRFFPEQFRVA
jgi:beta-phosphoglucomutase